MTQPHLLSLHLEPMGHDERVSNPGGIRLDSLPDEGDRRWRTSEVGARASAAAACGVLVLFLGGCSNGGVSVPPGADALEPCPIATIDVTSLGSDGTAGLQPRRLDAAFPAGEEFEVEESGVAGGMSSSRTPTHQVRAVNWGVPGVGAVDITDGVVTVWGSTQWAVELQLKQLALEGIVSTIKWRHRGAQPRVADGKPAAVEARSDREPLVAVELIRRRTLRGGGITPHEWVDPH